MSEVSLHSPTPPQPKPKTKSASTSERKTSFNFTRPQFHPKRKTSFNFTRPPSPPIRTPAPQKELPPLPIPPNLVNSPQAIQIPYETTTPLQPMNGTLWVVATPIGNLDDFSTRAVEVLRSVERVYAEDTRRFGKLAARYGITTDAKSCFEANEQARVAEILEYLKQGKDIALVSEAGTPCISDPGFRIVSACRDESCTVSPVPGASAAIAALSVSGFETDKFFFSGFLPQKSGRRERALTEALEFPAATIFYESPHRILKTLDQLQSLSPSRDIFIAREITKLHEECIRGSAKDVFEQFRSRPSIKGEFVLIVRGDGKGKPKTQQAESRG